MAARISKSTKSSSKSLKRNSKKVRAHQTRDMVIGVTVIGALGFLIGTGIEKAISYA